MKRTPAWVFVAAAMIQLAGLGLVVYAMERWSNRSPEDMASTEMPAAPEPPSSPAPVPETEPSDPAEPPVPWSPAEPPPAAAIVRTQIGEMPAPRFGPPPDFGPSDEGTSSPQAPAWIRDGATPTSQLLRGVVADGWLHVVFHPDRTLRLVDTDAGRYAGRVVDAAADLREDGGTRTLQVRIGVAADGRLQLSFVGGPHDAETVVLDDVVERFA